jgi:hypothetical protein
VIAGFIAFKLLLERIAAFAYALLANNSHTYFAEPAEISGITIGFDPPNIRTMPTSERG